MRDRRQEQLEREAQCRSFLPVMPAEELTKQRRRQLFMGRMVALGDVMRDRRSFF